MLSTLAYSTSATTVAAVRQMSQKIANAEVSTKPEAT
jgi:hypothetical protein